MAADRDTNIKKQINIRGEWNLSDIWLLIIINLINTIMYEHPIFLCCIFFLKAQIKMNLKK